MSKVLIIAPDKETIGLYKAALTFQGLEAITALSAEEGIEFLKECPKCPGLVLLDIMTPDLNKINLINEIQQQTKGEIPLIIVADMREDTELYKQSIKGACEYLFKSETTVGDIVRKVRKAIGE